MRKVLMVAAAAAIALVGLSANTCGGGKRSRQRLRRRLRAPEAPAAAPEAPAMAPETPPAAAPEAPAQ